MYTFKLAILGCLIDQNPENVIFDSLYMLKDVWCNNFSLRQLESPSFANLYKDEHVLIKETAVAYLFFMQLQSILSLYPLLILTWNLVRGGR